MPQSVFPYGVPPGGTTGQVLTKESDTDCDVYWHTVSGPGGQAFPVGSVFLSMVSTNPASLLGYGTWAALASGRVLVGVDANDPDFDGPGKTGGLKTVAAAGSNSAPTFTGSALGTHTHDAGTLVPSAHAGTAVANHASHTHTYTEVVQHTHTVNVTDPGHNHTQNSFAPRIINSGTAGTVGVQGASAASNASASNSATTATNQANTTGITATTSNPGGSVATGTTAGPNATLTHSVTQPDTHTMSGSTAATSAGTPAGSVSAPTFTGSPTSVVQPYLCVYLWQRTA